MDVFNVKSYGATGNGSTDDTGAVNAARNALVAAGGGVLYFPAGIYILSQSITIDMTGQKAVSIKGDGMEVSEIRFTDVDGFKATAGAGNYWLRAGGQQFAAFHASDLTLSTTSTSNTRHALWFDGGSLVGRPMPSPTISRVAFRGATTMEEGWWTGLVIQDASNSHVTDCEFIVCGEGKFKGRSIVYWTSASGKDATDHTITACNFVYGHTAVLATQYCEGIYMTNCSIVGVKYGVYWDCGENGAESLLAMNNCHINAAVRNILTRGVYDSSISNSLFYNFNSTAGNSNGSEDWIAIDMNRTGSTTITGNIIRGCGSAATSSYENGIVIQNANNADRGMTILGNTVEKIKNTGIWLQNNTSKIVLGPNAYAQCASPFINSGTGNRVLD
ncbi:hypothetical protein D3877_15545 [Azospirillum cavernae]|uniref:Rhamnogalacturonase A/B/Epimerase-like pectate lyase domain-containing protein n=1 Tax=Azospirillum cavernae TaxID=2320860 RepID=A0A418VWM2_9PROT|nr:right-handed parallel beta-helix repeat-containing protein [Azospirillum cavernae]RJF81555.1 hypothetical protein D3877_15545 [Azospirillum cavernae]